MRGSMRGVGVVAVVLAAVPATARAQSDDVSMSCEDFFDGSSMTSGDDILMGTDSIVRCDINFTNNSGFTRNNVWLRASFETATVSPLDNTLVDGIAGLSDPFSQTYLPMRVISSVPGSPVPTVDYVNQTMDFFVGSVPALFSSEVFFYWLPSLAFPQGSTAILVEAYEGGPPSTGSLVVDRPQQMVWDAPTTTGLQVLPNPIAEASNRYIGTAVLDIDSLADVQTNVEMRVYPPYWNGTAYVADGAYDDANPAHIPVVEVTDFAAELLLRDYEAALVQTMMPGTPLDALGDQSWPLIPPNANSLIRWDLDGYVLSGRPGLVGAAEGNGSTPYTHWRLRWNAGFDNVKSLFAGDVLPVQFCWSSDQTGPIAPGDPDHCETGFTTIGKESVSVTLDHYDCPSYFFQTCFGESRPFSPGDEGMTQALFSNATTVFGTGELVVQMPGQNGQKLATFTSASVGEGIVRPEYGPLSSGEAATSVEIWVSATPADFSGPDLTLRQVPAAGAVWFQCATTGGGFDPITCDASGLPIPASDVQEVRFVANDMRPQFVSLQDFNAWPWSAVIDWTLDATVAGSIDGTVYAPATGTGTAIAEKAVFEMEESTFSVYSDLDTDNAEVTRASLINPCGEAPNPFSFGTEFYAAYCSSGIGGSGYFTTVLTDLEMRLGIENAGTIDNVFGPIDLCMPVPYGIHFTNTVTSDPLFPRVFESDVGGTTFGGTSTQVPITDYTVSFTPVVDPYIEGDYCVHIPAYDLPAGRNIQFSTRFQATPGMTSPVTFQYPGTYWGGEVSALGEDALGNPIVIQKITSYGQFYLEGSAAVDVGVDAAPSDVIGPGGATCYDFEIDSHAYLDNGTATLDPSGATLPTEDAVAYIWVPSTTATQPSALTGTNSANFLFAAASSPDALATWIHTGQDPVRGDATTLATNGWQLCSVGAALCDDAALTAIGVSPAAVRWVALEIGTIEITDAEPRGQSPLDGNPRINNPYTATVCLEEDGTSPDGSQGLVLTETASSNLLTVYTEPPIVVIDDDCYFNQLDPSYPISSLDPTNPGYLTPEVCDGLDNDCDGIVPADELDADGDGFAPCEGDCDDTNPNVYPFAPELCDGLDDDCDTVIPADELDVDGDGTFVCDGDCDDADPNTYAGAPELCDGLDNDCDGSVPAAETDADADGVALCSGDCNDADGAIYLGAPELCDGIDNDCDGAVPASETDEDGDGLADCQGDCNDALASVYAGAPELCDSRDNDCDGLVPTDEQDGDGDGFSDCEGDCDDALASVFPGATEACDNIDQDCDGAADDGFALGDSCSVGVGACEAVGVTVCSPDGTGVVCDATEGTPSPETCNGQDDDCDGAVDATADADGTWSWCSDTDNDGILDATEHFDTGTDPADPDSDDDGLQDGTELGLDEPELPGATDLALFVPDEDPSSTTDPLDDDSDDDGLLDGVEDVDHNGAVGTTETDPNDADTDDGGVNDGEEVGRGTDPLDPSDDFTSPPDTGGAVDTGSPALDTGTPKQDTGYPLPDTGSPAEPQVERWVGNACSGCDGAPATGSRSLLTALAGLLFLRRRR